MTNLPRTVRDIISAYQTGRRDLAMDKRESMSRKKAGQRDSGKRPVPHPSMQGYPVLMFFVIIHTCPRVRSGPAGQRSFQPGL